jgi:hypothetical protein
MHSRIAREAGNKAAVETYTEGVFWTTRELEEILYVWTGPQRVNVIWISANRLVIEEN